MAQTITLHLPDETVHRYRRGAASARKLLEEFLIERLSNAAPPLTDDLPSPLREELEALDDLDDDALRELAWRNLSPERQRTYSRLLHKNSQGALGTRGQETLHTIGEEARRLTLTRAHACMLLQWRGHSLPSPAELQRP